MTNPTREAAEIVAGLLGPSWTAGGVLAMHGDAPFYRNVYAFARYVTEETEVTDAMLEAGEAARDRGCGVRMIFKEMIAAKHKGLLPAPVDPLAGVMQEWWDADGYANIETFYAVLAKHRGRIVFDGQPLEASPVVSHETPEVTDKPTPTIDEEAVLREAREAVAFTSEANGWPSVASSYRAGDYDHDEAMQALIAKTREVHELRAKLEANS